MKSCLIVDDSKVIRMVARKILQELDFETVEAADGKQALDACITKMPDAVLLDWNMPKLDGLKFVQIVRSLEKYEDTPIIMITSEAAKYNVVDAISAGVTNYVVKPIKGDILWEKIKRYIQ